MAQQPPPPALSNAPLAPGLYVVATPIGNLRDITLRALDVLAGVDIVLAEDTRVTGKLLKAYGLSAKLERYDEDFDYYWGDYKIPLWIALIWQVPWRQRLDIFVIGLLVGLIIAGIAVLWGLLLSQY